MAAAAYAGQAASAVVVCVLAVSVCADKAGVPACSRQFCRGLVRLVVRMCYWLQSTQARSWLPASVGVHEGEVLWLQRRMQGRLQVLL